MTRPAFVGAASFGAAIALGASVAWAAGPETTFKEVVGRGYQVVATTLIPKDVNGTKNSVIVVTLQSGKSVAVCTFDIGTWENMAGDVDTNETACDYRSY